MVLPDWTWPRAPLYYDRSTPVGNMRRATHKRQRQDFMNAPIVHGVTNWSQCDKRVGKPHTLRCRIGCVTHVTWLTPPPNLEAEIFRQILLPSGYQEARRTVIYPMWSAGGVSVRAGLPGGGALQRTMPRLSGVYSAGEWHTSAQICRLMCSDQCADVTPRDTRIRRLERTAALISHCLVDMINSGVRIQMPEISICKNYYD